MSSGYDLWALQYADLMDHDALTPGSIKNFLLDRILAVAGSIEGHTLLDAGCGAGHLSVILADHGASVTAIDVSEPLIGIARDRHSHERINYLCRDIAKGLPEYGNTFDLVVANLVLNDTPEYSQFIRTMGQSTKPGGLAVVTINSPYSAVIRGKVADYADSGVCVEYAGLARAGIHVNYYHRTMEELVQAIHDAGYLIERLEDLIPGPSAEPSQFAEKFRHSPYLMLLSLRKPR
jgi:2-polyprenyl-3-methyl-5-hydroxy-6-metoxy-1,4-benzoquinol methylase